MVDIDHPRVSIEGATLRAGGHDEHLYRQTQDHRYLHRRDDGGGSRYRTCQRRCCTPVTNWEIHLKGSTAHRTANGSAQYQSQPGQREIQIEVQRIRSMAGRTVVFSAAGVRLGSAKVSTRGQADITRNTELGQRVPSIVHGSNVNVRTSGGALIVSGRF